MKSETTNIPSILHLPLFLTAAQAREILNISQSTLLRSIKKGSIPNAHLGRRILIPRNAIEDLIEKSYQNMKN